MGRPKKQVVESALQAEKQIQEASAPQDYSNVPMRKEDPSVQITRAEKKNVLKLTYGHSFKVPCKRQISEQEKRERDYMWEYVEGIFENRALFGETLSFWMNPYPGDPYAEWTVPCNIPVSVPRWVAHHLNTRKYVTFKSRDKNVAMSEANNPNVISANFEPSEVIQRTTFMPLRAYG